MSRKNSESIILSILIAAGVSACGNAKREEPAPSPTPQTELSQSTQAAVDEALREYEAIRDKLAADQTSGLADAANKIASAATGAIDKAPEHLRPFLQSMAEQATKLGAAGADIEQNRLTFGEVSRAVVGLIVAEPSLQRGRFVFHCPMAKGYKKWVQIDAQLENPYMGKRMPKCGTKSNWEV